MTKENMPDNENETLGEPTRKGNFIFRLRENKNKQKSNEQESDGLPSVNRKRKGGKAVSTLGFIFMLVVGSYLIWQVNTPADDPKKPAESPENKDSKLVRGNTLPPFTPPQPPVELQVETQVPPLAPSSTTSPGSGIAPAPGGQPGESWLTRKMGGQVMAANQSSGSQQKPQQQQQQRQLNVPSMPMPLAPDGAQEGQIGGDAESNLATRLQSTRTEATKARLLPNRDFLVALGTPLECTLETALDTTLPGITKCILTNDLYSDNGHVRLAETGSELTGEQQGNIKQGEARVFVLWTRLKTLDGVVVDLNSPGTDSLGRSGLEGWVDNHFAERFKSAILMSIVQASIKIVVERAKKTSDTASIVADNSDDSTDVVSQTLESTINIPPTLLKNQGERIQVMVARDLDFSSVYSLRVK